jgi:hypothetical protein
MPSAHTQRCFNTCNPLASTLRRQLPRTQRERSEGTDHEEKGFFLSRISLQLAEMLVAIFQEMSQFLSQDFADEISK